MKTVSIPARIAALATALLLCVSVLASCAGGSGNTGTTAPDAPGSSAPAGSENTAAETEPPVLTDEYGRPVEEDGLPAEADLGGRTFVVHTRGNVDQYEWTAEDQNGEILHDAIYKRNTNVEERFKIDIKVIAEGTWQDYGTNLEKVKASIKSGDGAYDLLCGYSTPIASMATSGLIYNLREVPHIDLEKPWWSRGFTDEFTINDTLYFGVGSLSIAMIYSIECLFVNTDIMKEVASGYNIYKTVEDREWTWEELNRLSALAYIEVNGTGERYGLISAEANNSTNTLAGFFYSTGVKLVTKDGDGNLVINDDMEQLTGIIDKEIELLYKTTSNYSMSNADPLRFEDGKGLFCYGWLYNGQTRFSQGMKEYGIIPLPMLNLDQKEYCTPVQGGMHMYALPNDVNSIDENGMITEALAAESYRVLMPAYYEVVLKTRYVSDSQSSRMIDIMYDTVVFDIGFTYNSTLQYFNAIRSAISSGALGGAASTLRSAIPAAKRNLDNFVSHLGGK